MMDSPHTRDAASADQTALPAVSLILPVHNGARYLREALDSIFRQSFTQFELIAIDDCSQDASPAILAEYAARDPRMRVITNPENRKLPGSLNIGFRAARGRWLSWTSDDNLLRPDTLARLVCEAEAAGNADIVYANYRIIDEDGHPRNLVEVGPAEDLVFGNVVGCCFLYRREVDRALGGYDEQLFGVEDYDFWLRAARQGFRFRPMAEELYSYRRHANSLTDRRARSIQALTAQVMLPGIAALPASPRRAQAYVRLACRDPYTLRWGLLVRALRDHPPTVLNHWRHIAGWLKYSLRVRHG